MTCWWSFRRWDDWQDCTNCSMNTVIRAGAWTFCSEQNQAFVNHFFQEFLDATRVTVLTWPKDIYHFISYKIRLLALKQMTSWSTMRIFWNKSAVETYIWQMGDIYLHNIHGCLLQHPELSLVVIISRKRVELWVLDDSWIMGTWPCFENFASPILFLGKANKHKISKGKYC